MLHWRRAAAADAGFCQSQAVIRAVVITTVSL
jgi:hypothetical protein